jgi:hypothetical protein
MFFPEKEQKTFVPWRAGSGEPARKGTKVFCFFSSEKNSFLEE